MSATCENCGNDGSAQKREPGARDLCGQCAGAYRLGVRDGMTDLLHVGKLAPLGQVAPSGVAVLVVKDGGKPSITKTRSEPWKASEPNRWLVMLEGASGGYSLDRVFMLPAWNEKKGGVL